MAYTINLTNGSIFATVADGTIDTTSSLTLVGKNYAGYGESLNENVIKLLETGANATAPTAPLVGQLWYDTATSRLKVHNGTAFKPFSASTSGATTPTSNVVGDTWFDTVNSQLKVYDGSSFVLVGGGIAGSLSGAIVETAVEGVTPHVIVKLMSAGTVVAIVSKDASFVPNTPITGFATIEPGIQLSSTVSTAKFVGDVTNALRLGGQLASKFLRNDINGTITGTLLLQNDGGLTVGAASDGSIKVSSGHVILNNATAGKDMLLQVQGATVITIDGVSDRARVSSPIASTDIANRDYVDTAIGTRAPTSHTHEGTAVLSTAETVGKVLTADGAGAATWETPTVPTLQTTVINIGDWNMDTVSGVTVPHGLTLANIRSLSATVRNDTAASHYDLYDSNGSGLTGSSVGIEANATNILLFRQTSNLFDNAGFSATGFNRGWIVIQHI